MEAAEAIITPALAQKHAERRGPEHLGNLKWPRAEMSCCSFVVTALPLSGARPSLLSSALAEAAVPFLRPAT